MIEYYIYGDSNAELYSKIIMVLYKCLIYLFIYLFTPDKLLYSKHDITENNNISIHFTYTQYGLVCFSLLSP